jgi:hypothetical protein
MLTDEACNNATPLTVVRLDLTHERDIRATDPGDKDTRRGNAE